MPTVETLTERVPPISSTASVPDVFNWFQAHPDIQALPVVHDGRPVGLIDRQDFLLKLASPLGNSRYANRPVSWIMDSDPPVVEANTRISAFSDLILKSSASTLMRSFIVTDNGQYLGLGTAIRLFHFVNNQQAERIAEQQAEIDELKARHVDEKAVAKAQTRFVDTLVTTLRQPLETVDAFANLLERQHLAPEHHDHVEAIQQASREGQNLLGMARDLANAEAGEFSLNRQPTVLRSITERLAAEWKDRAESAGVSLVVGYEGDTELTVEIDEARFLTTCGTLLGNALKWSRDGMVEFSLKAKIVDQDVDLEVRVRDDGASLDDDQLANCFGPFWQTGDIGTSMSWHLVTSMGGRIFAERNHGRGTTYGFDTRVERTVAPVAEETTVARLEGLELSSRPHVLIADDNATNRVVARALCEMFGCTSETVEDGQEAVDTVRGGNFDLILMDIKMPRLDGVQATRAIRALPDDRSTTPIIALTANADPDDVAGYLDAGMVCVVEKPIKPERLRMAILRALSSREETVQAEDHRLDGTHS
ncbi:response regulator [uncultured Brevundimonas sp.]|uniref:response regulator n=1 Tax=uncultured Brevundimonas sp. TaxID=213418 RepID=UPI002636B61C|nr:response regulator [uncultured Brevundimonas sp.]